MKKTVISVLLVLCMTLTMALPAFASEPESIRVLPTASEMIYNDDGSYLVIELNDVSTLSKAAGVTKASSFTKTGNKVISSYSSSDELEWRYTLFVEYSVNPGISAVCTSATYTKTIYDSSWKFSDGDAYASGNTGYGKGVFKEKFLFLTLTNVIIDVSISCDVNGVLS